MLCSGPMPNPPYHQASILLLPSPPATCTPFNAIHPKPQRESMGCGMLVSVCDSWRRGEESMARGLAERWG